LDRGRWLLHELGGASVANERQQQIAILSSGIWQLRGAIRQITQLEPVRWMPPFSAPDFGCVAGWGLKATTKRARTLARRNEVGFLALEDGFIRSVHPGADSAPISLVVDHSGVHYDATAKSDLEALIAASAANFDEERRARSLAGMQLLKRLAVSKYNHAPMLTEAELGLSPSRRKGRVLLVDQTVGDCSIVHGLASHETFAQMLEAAISENPEAEFVVKVHPEVVSRHKKGHFAELKDKRVTLVQRDVNPWSLINVVDKVYTVTSQLGFEALMAGKQVACFGLPFYAGWGLTDDRITIDRRSARPTIEQLFAAVYFDYSHYISPESGRQISFEDAAAWLARERDTYLAGGRAAAGSSRSSVVSSGLRRRLFARSSKSPKCLAHVD
jgi:capsular polysaccharide export protein